MATNPPLVTITGTIANGDGVPFNGDVDLRFPVALRADDGTTISAGRFSVLVTDGVFEAEMPYVDSVGWNPVNWSYSIYMPSGQLFGFNREYWLSPKTADGPAQDLDSLLAPPGSGEQQSGDRKSVV